MQTDGKAKSPDVASFLRIPLHTKSRKSAFMEVIALFASFHSRWIKTNKFNTVGYYKHNNAEFRETAEKDFKALVAKICKFEMNNKNEPLLEFAYRLRDTRFEVIV